MSEHMMSDWNAVRAQLEWPPHDRYSEAGLSDADLRYYLERATQDIGALSEYGVTPDDSRLDRVNELLRRIELGAKITRPAARLSDFAEMMGGGLSEEEKLFVDKKISNLESELESVVLGMSGHAGKQLRRRLTGLELAEHNEAREKKEYAERERETRVAQIMINKKVSREDAVAELERQPFAEINLERARELGLERVEITGNKAAQKLMERVFDQSRADKFDILNSDPRLENAAFAKLLDEWTRTVGAAVPIPMTDQSKYYMECLAQGNIIANRDANKKIVARPRFDKSIALWMENWEEADYTDAKLRNTISPLLQELEVINKHGKTATSVVEISRDAIDDALWSGDPSLKRKTPKHEALIRKLGLDPAHYNFRLIAQDEYARLAGSGKNLGKCILWTWFNDYLVEGADVLGLSGGLRIYGGPSRLASDYRDNAAENLAVRLVLECSK